MILKEQVRKLMKKGVLVSPELLGKLEENPEKLNEMVTADSSVVILDRGAEQLISRGEQGINWTELEKTKVLLEKEKDSKKYLKVVDILQKKTVLKGKVKIVDSYNEPSRKYDVKDFTALFNSRFKSVQSMLSTRPELASPISISHAAKRPERELTNVIAMVSNKQLARSGNITLMLEDSTGELRAIATKAKVNELAKDLVLDEVVGISGMMSNGALIISEIVLPDIPNKELKKAPENGYAIFLSDLHVGSKNFLKDDFSRFTEWVNQRSGTEEQRAMAEQVKYIFLAGDLVDGIGVYPEQNKELEIRDIYGQYERCAELLLQLPKDIPIIFCPGNHDATRMAEPQPALFQDYTKPILKLQNIIPVSNPALVNIDSSENFSGFDVLLYHGYSFDYYVANVDSIRRGGGYDRADLIMSFLLKRRHLAPVHTSTLYLPNAKKDPLLIDKIPDLFVTGHIHKSSVSNYKNTTLICGSCWQSKTTFQERVGHHPEPSRVPIIELKTRKAKILKFGK